MSVTAIRIGCDTPACWAYCQVEASTVEAAREKAADLFDWTLHGDQDICPPCDKDLVREENAQHWRERADQAGRLANERGAALEWVRLALDKFDARTRWDTDDVVELLESVRTSLARPGALLPSAGAPPAEEGQ